MNNRIIAKNIESRHSREMKVFTPEMKAEWDYMKHGVDNNPYQDGTKDYKLYERRICELMVAGMLS